MERLIVQTRVTTDRLHASAACGISCAHCRFAGGVLFAIKAWACGHDPRAGWLSYLHFATPADGLSVALAEVASYWRESPRLAAVVAELRPGLPTRPRYTVIPWRVESVDFEEHVVRLAAGEEVESQ